MRSFTRRLLVVDDNRDMCELIAEEAREGGYDVIVANNAADALIALDRDEIDAVVADVVMPGMNGIELARRIKFLRPGLPVVLMTGHFEIMDAVVATGAVPLLKPISTQRLIDVVRDTLGQSPDGK